MDFDEMTDRRGTGSMKWDAVGEVYGLDPHDCLPMWVADSDFRAAPVVLDALERYVRHGVFGYHGDYATWRGAIRRWMDTRHGWAIEDDWILPTPGVVPAVAVALQAFTAPDDGVLLFTPVYHAFARVIRANGRRVVEAEMTVAEDGMHRLDLDSARTAVADGGVRMVILCTPHNPGGRVWTRDELAEVVRFAEEHDLILISDEIHQDLVLPGATHVPTALIEGASPRLLTLTAASKAFNLPGFHQAHAIIGDPDLRRRFEAPLRAHGATGNAAGLIATAAAFTDEGAAWLDAQIAYLDANRRAFDAAVNAIPGVRSMPLQSTYLAWVDFTGTGMTQEEIETRVMRGAGIAANKGPTFGAGGTGWMRFNLATQRALVDEAAARLTRAFADLQ